MIFLNSLTKVLLAASVGVSVPIATLAQVSLDFLWPYLGWLAVALYMFVQFFLPLLVPIGLWVKSIMEYISTYFESSPTPDATNLYILLAVIIVVVGIIVNMVKPKPAFVEELEAKYDHPPETTR